MRRMQKLIRIPMHIITAVEAYQRDNGIVSFTASILELLRKVLKDEGYL